jgi:hypothetical protein
LSSVGVILHVSLFPCGRVLLRVAAEFCPGTYLSVFQGASFCHSGIHSIP